MTADIRQKDSQDEKKKTSHTHRVNSLNGENNKGTAKKNNRQKAGHESKTKGKREHLTPPPMAVIEREAAANPTEKKNAKPQDEAAENDGHNLTESVKGRSPPTNEQENRNGKKRHLNPYRRVKTKETTKETRNAIKKERKAEESTRPSPPKEIKGKSGRYGIRDI